MSRYAESLEIDEQTAVRTNVKAIWAVVVAVALGVTAWVTLRADVNSNTKRLDSVQTVTTELIAVKMDVSNHTKQLDSIAAVQSADHDMIIELRTASKEQKTLLQYLAEGRRGPVPATGGSGGGSSP